MNPTNPNDPHNDYQSCCDEGITPEFAALIDDHEDAKARVTDATDGDRGSLCPSCGGPADDGLDVDGSPHQCLACQRWGISPPLIGGGQGRSDYDPAPREFHLGSALLWLAAIALGLVYLFGGE